jgi:glycosyltransferase involved in cell wall biosynthesis
VVSGETGVLVRLGDIEGLADAVVRLAEDRSLRENLGRNGRERCLRSFDWRRMVDQIERLYTTGLGSVA